MNMLKVKKTLFFILFLWYYMDNGKLMMVNTQH
jgi:hypothetical protein